MLTVNKRSPTRLDIELDGVMDSELMQVAIEDLIAKSEGIEHGRMLYTIKNFEWPTGGAIGVELTHLPQLFRMIGRFDRCAVLAEEGWIRTAAEIEGALIPGLEIKSFHLNEAKAAEDWLAVGAQA